MYEAIITIAMEKLSSTIGTAVSSCRQAQKL